MGKIKILFLIFFVCAFDINAQFEYPILKTFLTDNGNLFSSNEVVSLEKKLKSYQDKTTNQIVVVTIEDLQGKTIEECALKVFQKNKIGQEKKDNGILFLISKKDRKIRIEVGYGLEGLLTDALCSRIIREQMIPLLKKQNYYGAVDLGIYSIVSILHPGNTIIEKSDVSEELEEDKWDWLKNKIAGIVFYGFILFFFGTLFFLTYKFAFLRVYENLINLIRGFIVGKIAFFSFFGHIIPVYFMLFFTLAIGITLLFLGFMFGSIFIYLEPKYFFKALSSNFRTYKIGYLVFGVILCYIAPVIIAFFNRKHVKSYPLKLSFRSDANYLKKYLVFSSYSEPSSRTYSSTGRSRFSSSRSQSSWSSSSRSSSSSWSSSSSSSSSTSFSGGGGSSGGGGASGSW